MLKFYFTFGLGGPNAHVYQPVEAPDWMAARKAVMDIHGDKWAFQYTQQEFHASKSQGFFKNLTPLETIIVHNPTE